MRLFPILLLCTLLNSQAFSQSTLTFHGGGEYQAPTGICLTETQRSDIQLDLNTQVEKLSKEGLIPETNRNSVVQFSWPLASATNLDWGNYYGISNYVDQDPSIGVDEYNCGSRTYNGHAGTDYFTWPFPHYLKENDLVEVVSAAPGVITQKTDGQFDEQCDLNSSLTWNAVYVTHSDGSIAWYGHLKEGSLTTKSVGESVEAGEYLGIVASSGFSSGPHLHFEVHDENNDIIDPYAGACNNLNSESWWLDQPEYEEMQLNLSATHSAIPEVGCPSGNENPHFSNQFNSSETVYFGSYFKDQNTDVTVEYTVLTSSGTVYNNWTHQSPFYYYGSWWYWSLQMPLFADYGEWTFRVQFNGQTHDHTFFVGDLPSGLNDHLSDDLVQLYLQDETLNVRSELAINSAAIYDSMGRLSINKSNYNSDPIYLGELAPGVYIVQLLTEQGIASKRILKD